MKWGEIQIESLKKMFLNNDNLSIENIDNYKNDKKYKTYLFAMPQACNEAINYICNQLPMDGKIYELDKDTESDYYYLTNLIDDYSKVIDVITSNKNITWNMVSRNILKIDNWTNENDTVSILYEYKPDVITEKTKNNYEIELPMQYVNLIPLYIAGELYKDDDLSLATMYMNEFMTLIDNYKNNSEFFSNPVITSVFSIE